MTKCYTFYSYKGGSGRSTTAVNTVGHLIDVLGADSSHPILIVDADLESRKKDFNWKFDGSKYPRFLNLFVKNVGSMAHGGIWE